MAVTRTQIRQEMYERIPGLGFSGTSDSYTTTSLTDAFALADTSLGPNAYRGFYIYRYLLTTDDRIKKANLLNTSTGQLSHTGSAYANTDAGVYEIVGLLHPDELNACIKRAMRRVYYELQEVLPGRVVDGTMETSGVASWTASNANLAKDLDDVFTGTQAMSVTNTAANGAATQTFNVLPNTPFYASAVVKCTSGDTARLLIDDVTNTAEIASISTTETDWVQISVTGTVPATCRSLKISIGSPNNGDITYWNHAVLYMREELMLNAPSWLDEQHKFLKLREAEYPKIISNETDGTINQAASRKFQDWIQPSQFTLDPFHNDVVAYRVQLNKPIPNAELWIEGKRPWSDITDMAEEADTTDCPPNLIYAYSQEEIARTLRRRYPNDKRFDIILAEAALEMDAQTVSRVEIPMQPRKREHWLVV